MLNVTRGKPQKIPLGWHITNQEKKVIYTAPKLSKVAPLMIGYPSIDIRMQLISTLVSSSSKIGHYGFQSVQKSIRGAT